jgi:hypothetical protein
VGLLDADLERVRGPAGSGTTSVSPTGDLLRDLVPAAGPVVEAAGFSACGTRGRRSEAGTSVGGTGASRRTDGGGGLGGRWTSRGMGGVGWSWVGCTLAASWELRGVAGMRLTWGVGGGGRGANGGVGGGDGVGGGNKADVAEMTDVAEIATVTAVAEMPAVVAEVGVVAEMGAVAEVGVVADVGEVADVGAGADVGEVADVGGGAEVGEVADVGAGADVGEVADVGAVAAVGLVEETQVAEMPSWARVCVVVAAGRSGGGNDGTEGNVADMSGMAGVSLARSARGATRGTEETERADRGTTEPKEGAGERDDERDERGGGLVLARNPMAAAKNLLSGRGSATASVGTPMYSHSPARAASIVTMWSSKSCNRSSNGIEVLSGGSGSLARAVGFITFVNSWKRDSDRPKYCRLMISKPSSSESTISCVSAKASMRAWVRIHATYLGQGPWSGPMGRRPFVQRHPRSRRASRHSRSRRARRHRNCRFRRAHRFACLPRPRPRQMWTRWTVGPP